jgi:hypothetical protein
MPTADVLVADDVRRAHSLSPTRSAVMRSAAGCRLRATRTDQSTFSSRKIRDIRRSLAAKLDAPQLIMPASASARSSKIDKARRDEHEDVVAPTAGQQRQFIARYFATTLLELYVTMCSNR